MKFKIQLQLLNYMNELFLQYLNIQLTHEGIQAEGSILKRYDDVNAEDTSSDGLVLDSEPDVQVPLDEIEIDENLRFVEEPIEIVERDVKKLKRRRIPLVKVRWNSRQGAEYTWEREDQFQKKYPNLFSEPVPSSSAAT
ncbi:hypothetical protein Tco_0890729 [Tanacetum coccineum]|uniref:Reverse transcriptase domain-containing protein n=1 Tax=Tanacetum coccineum TaxID=301880 RepID=A0ABQ5C3W8_9ASTR